MHTSEQLLKRAQEITATTIEPPVLSGSDHLGALQWRSLALDAIEALRELEFKRDELRRKDIEFRVLKNKHIQEEQS